MPRMFAASRGARSRCITKRASTEAGRISRRGLWTQYVFIRIYAEAGGATRLISQRLASFECMRDALLCLVFTAKRDERFAFEIEHVLFADKLRRAQCSARKNIRQF